ncbi:hypothetical protein BH11BAC5_BH11BAC5_41950 [soil metagenome]
MNVVKWPCIEPDSKRDRGNVLSHAHCFLRDIAGNRVIKKG